MGDFLAFEPFGGTRMAETSRFQPWCHSPATSVRLGALWDAGGQQQHHEWHHEQLYVHVALGHEDAQLEQHHVELYGQQRDVDQPHHEHGEHGDAQHHDGAGGLTHLRQPRAGQQAGGPADPPGGHGGLCGCGWLEAS